jgi:DNA-binding response OmpR family regulator
LATVLLAIGDGSLRETCSTQLEAAGHSPLRLERSLALRLLSRTVIWDAVCVDASKLGNEALKALVGAGWAETPVVGLGCKEPGVTASIPLPLDPERLLAALQRLRPGNGVHASGCALRLDRSRRLAVSGERAAALTRTEFLLLEVLYERRPREVAAVDILQAVWGSMEGRSTSELIRAHVRNLRRKLLQIGMEDAVQSRRGRGYALAV